MIAADETIVPIREKVLVRLLPEEEYSEGGIMLPESCREYLGIDEAGYGIKKPRRWLVVAVGEGKLLVDEETCEVRVKEPQVSAGDVVVMGTYEGTQIDLDGVEHRLVCEDEIMVVVQEASGGVR